MGLFGRSSTTSPAALVPPGVGGGISQDQMNMFAQAANDSGLTGLGMGMLDQVTGGGINTDEVELMYHLMARHPNEVDLFFVGNPDFLSGLAELISTIMKRELYIWFNSEAIAASVNAATAAELGYSTITQENIDTILSKMYSADAGQQRINAADAEAINLINQHKYGMQMGGMQAGMMNQQQQFQQQMYQQQMMQNQQPQGISGALGSFGSTLLRGSLGLPPAPNYNQQYPQQQGMYSQQQGMYQQPNGMQ
jgi:hypothetical protein